QQQEGIHVLIRGPMRPLLLRIDDPQPTRTPPAPPATTPAPAPPVPAPASQTITPAGVILGLGVGLIAVSLFWVISFVEPLEKELERYRSENGQLKAAKPMTG